MPDILGLPKMHTVWEFMNEYTGGEIQESNSKETRLRFWPVGSRRPMFGSWVNTMGS